jgi:hypothetical protein
MTIKLTDVIKYYKGLPHQSAALDYLQSNIDPYILGEFAKKFRGSPLALLPPKPIDTTPLGRILTRLAELGIKLTKPTKGYNAYMLGLEGCNSDFSVSNDALDGWNDAVGVLCIDSNGQIKLSQLFQGTTEPGRYYVQNRLNPEGAAVALIDYLHKDIWVRGAHKDQQNCLIQEGAEISVVRDGNGNGRRDASEPIRTGFFGINMHHTKGNYDIKSIGRWSAGCTVIPNVQQHQYLMGIVNKAENKKISYILLDRSKIK